MKKMRWVSTIFALLFIFIAPRFNNYLDGKLDEFICLGGGNYEMYDLWI